jgi:hypothetical protein
MKYFESFPKTTFILDETNNNFNQQLVTNILARSTFLREIANNTSIAYEYSIKESDTPEILAHKVYGDAYRSWVILLLNNIINPYYDWPMKEAALNTYIYNKYGQDLDQAKSTIHHYEKETTKTSAYGGLILDKEITVRNISEYEINPITNAISATPSLPTTADTSLSYSTDVINYTNYTLTIAVVHKAVSNYTYEFLENENKRKIKLLEEKYVQRVEDEFRNLMSNG